MRPLHGVRMRRLLVIVANCEAVVNGFACHQHRPTVGTRIRDAEIGANLRNVPDQLCVEQAGISGEPNPKVGRGSRRLNLRLPDRHMLAKHGIDDGKCIGPRRGRCFGEAATVGNRGLLNGRECVDQAQGAKPWPQHGSGEQRYRLTRLLHIGGRANDVLLEGRSPARYQTHIA